MEDKKFLKVEIPEGYEIDDNLSTFDKIVFKPIKSKYPKSWEDAFSGKKISGFFIESNSSIETCKIDAYISDKNVLKTEKQAKKVLAYAQITQLMALPCYNGDWIPDFSEMSYKYFIVRIGNRIAIDHYMNRYCELTFKDKETCEAFYKNHMDLLRTYFEID